MLRRLVNLACLLLFAIWTVLGIPVLRDLSNNAVLASRAVLGALALVFQGLLRDFVAGLVLLLNDRYAIGDVIEIGGHSGEVVDVGVLSTELRGADQRVVVVPNSHCEQVVNHTKLRSGAELLEPPRLLGIEAMTEDDLQVKALLITEAGQQGEARRELLGRLVQRLQGWP